VLELEIARLIGSGTGRFPRFQIGVYVDELAARDVLGAAPDAEDELH